MSNNGKYLNAYLDLQTGWLNFAAIFMNHKDLPVRLVDKMEGISSDSLEIPEELTGETIEEQVKEIFEYNGLSEYIPYLDMPLDPKTKENIALCLQLRSVRIHTEEDVLNFFKEINHPVYSFLRSLKRNYPQGTINLGEYDKVKDYFFENLAVGQSNENSFEKYIVDTLFTLYNVLTYMPVEIKDAVYNEEIKIKLEVLIKMYMESVSTNTCLDKSFMEELTTCLNAYNHLMLTTPYRMKPDYKIYGLSKNNVIK